MNVGVIGVDEDNHIRKPTPMSWQSAGVKRSDQRKRMLSEVGLQSRGYELGLKRRDNSDVFLGQGGFGLLILLFCDLVGFVVELTAYGPTCPAQSCITRGLH
jgi:hypothetical protein